MKPPCTPHVRVLRPILMTSFAFILGVAPLAVATGAGAEMRQSLGTAVLFGMIGVTCFGLLLTPAFYTFIRKLGRGERHDRWGYHITSGEVVDIALDAEPPIRRIYACSELANQATPGEGTVPPVTRTRLPANSAGSTLNCAATIMERSPGG